MAYRVRVCRSVAQCLRYLRCVKKYNVLFLVIFQIMSYRDNRSLEIMLVISWCVSVLS